MNLRKAINAMRRALLLRRKPRLEADAEKREFRWAESIKEERLGRRGFQSLGNLFRDLRFGARQLRKNPGFATVAVATLALGIGANTTIFSVIQGVLLAPLPYRDPDRLVRLFESSAGQPRFPMSAGDFQDYREQNSMLAGLALYTRQDLELAKDDQPELLAALRITAGYFDVLGARPLLGREFVRDDEAPNHHHVVVLSHGLWQRRFNGDREVVGKVVMLTGEAFTVVGVMPPGVLHVGGDYRSMPHGETVDFWWPMTLRPQDNRGAHYLNAVGRLKPGVTPAQAAADMNVIAGRLARQFPDTDGAFHITVQPLHEEIVGRSRTTLMVLFCAVWLVLLSACVNVANLLLARAAARSREMAVRGAVGAGRWRIARQLLAESLLLAAVSSAAGIMIAQAGIVALGKFGPDQLPRLQSVRLDGHVLLFTIGLTFLTGLLFGLAPAWQAGRANLHGVMKEGGHGGRVWRLRDALVAAEVALALLLLVSTGLLVRSFARLQNAPAGFRAANVLTAVVSLPYTGYGDGTNRAAFFRTLLDRLTEVPGVESAGLTSDLPWTGYDENAGFEVEGRTSSSGDGPGGRYHYASADYFRTVGVPLIAGRFFDGNDVMGKRSVILVNRSLADRYWPGVSAVGKRITFSSTPKEEDWRTVVGVVGDVKDHPDSAAAMPAFYFCADQSPMRQAILAVRTTGPPYGMIAALRNELQKIDRNVPLAEVKTLDSVTAEAVAGRRFTSWLVGGFAAMAPILAAVGIYGVLSYLVSQRTREIGVRMALGAQAGDVVRLTFQQGMRPTLIGVGCGLAGALALTRLLSSLLFEVSARDPATFVASALILILAATVPCWLPARRAARVNPMVALRAD